MCGRTCLSLSKYQIQCACSYKPRGSNKYAKPEWLSEHNAGKEYVPSYNISPTEVTPILMSGSKYKNATPLDRVLKPMMWGIIPPWHKGDYRSHKLSTNNCRLENIKGSKLYNPILNNGGRCIILVEGFYEWQTTKVAKTKQPYYIYSPQNENMQDPDTEIDTFDEDNGWTGIRPLFMAGLYNEWKHEGTIIYSYSVITMESNHTLSWLHHRMPAILDTEEQIQGWLDIDNVEPDLALSFLRPVKILSWHTVSTAVNNSRNKTEECNKKISTEEKKNIKHKTFNAWFTSSQKRKSDMDSAESDSKRDNKRICK